MSVYTTRERLYAYLPRTDVERCASDGSGSVDETIDAVIEAASREVDALIGSVAETPFDEDDVPAFASHAATVLAAYRLLQRGGLKDDENPLADARGGVKEQAQRIVEGRDSLTPSAAAGAVEDVTTEWDAASGSSNGL